MGLKQVVVLLGAALLPTAFWAGTAGSISGTVKDPSGAVIPGATVVITKTATNVQTKTVTDDRGFYAFSGLQVMRFFGGLSVEETAEVLKVSPATVRRDWSIAKFWLYRELGGETGDGFGTVETTR